MEYCSHMVNIYEKKFLIDLFIQVKIHLTGRLLYNEKVLSSAFFGRKCQ